MIGWRVVPTVLACLLLAAHFLRAGQVLMVVACSLAPGLLLVSHRMARVALRVVLWGGAAMWVVEAVAIARRRIAFGQPWIRMALILGGVSLFTWWASSLLRTPRGADPDSGTPRAEPTSGAG